MYKCKKCGKSSKPGEQRLTHKEYHEIWDENQEKHLRQIKTETPVCKDCYKEESAK